LALIGLLLPILVAGPGGLTVARVLPFPQASDGRRPVLFSESCPRNPLTLGVEEMPPGGETPVHLKKPQGGLP